MKKMKVLIILSAMLLSTAVLAFSSSLASPDQDVTLSIIVTDQQKQAIDGIISDFLSSDLGTGVDAVDVISSGTRADDQLTYLVTQMTAESTEFDVIGLDTIWPAQFAENKWIVELTDLLESNEMDDYVDGMVDSCTYDDKIWAYPYFMNLGVMFYRKDIVERNGFAISDFDTWDELKTNTNTILANVTEQTLNPDLVGFVGQLDAYEGGVCNFMEWMGGNGVTELFDSKGNAVVNTTEAIYAMDYLKGLIAPRYTGVQGTDYIMPRSILTMDEGSSVGMWCAGNAIFMRQWTFAYSNSATTAALNATDATGNYTQFGVAPLPTRTGAAEEKSSVVGGAVLALSEFGTHKTEAMNLIRYLGDTVAQKYELSEKSNFPALKSTYDDLPAGCEWAGEFYDAFAKTLSRPVHPKYSLISTEIADKFSDLLSGVKTVPLALGEMESDINEVISGRPTAPGFELPLFIFGFATLALVIRYRKK